MKLRLLLIHLTLTCFWLQLQAQNNESISNLKAAFIYNFTKYIIWDDNSDGDKNKFTVGVIGKSPITAALQQIAATSTVNNKRIQIQVFDKPEEITYCNILFIPAGNPFPLKSILNKVRTGTLTISEQKDFAKEGTAFNFVVINRKLKFETNLQSLQAAGLKASSQLLKLAIIVDK
jgi:hypothetical protein